MRFTFSLKGFDFFVTRSNTVTLYGIDVFKIARHFSIIFLDENRDFVEKESIVRDLFFESDIFKVWKG